MHYIVLHVVKSSALALGTCAMHVGGRGGEGGRDTQIEGDRAVAAGTARCLYIKQSLEGERASPCEREARAGKRAFRAPSESQHPRNRARAMGKGYGRCRARARARRAVFSCALGTPAFPLRSPLLACPLPPRVLPTAQRSARVAPLPYLPAPHEGARACLCSAHLHSLTQPS
ncbi:hypothetical protein K523DRAFT_133520 [Schizophyllum commune Tattone D]|nr:hypothetical protein K523DRAFT_133520 [Schizophyllum commune Tattone D]